MEKIFFFFLKVEKKIENLKMSLFSIHFMSEQQINEQEETVSNGGDSSEPKKTIYISNIPYNTEENELNKLFSKFGEIENVNILRKQDNKTAIAFISFADPKSVPDALDEMNQTTLNGKKITVELAKRNRGYRPGSRTPNDPLPYAARTAKNSYDSSRRDKYDRYDDRPNYDYQRQRYPPESYDRRPPYDNYYRYDDYQRRDPYPDRQYSEYDRRYAPPPPPPPSRRYDDRYAEYDRRPYSDYPRDDRYRGQYPY